LSLTLAAATAQAAPAPLVIIVQADAAKLVPPVALGEKLANDLDIPVLVQPVPPPLFRGVLTISWDEQQRRIVLTYRDANGDEMTRVFADGLDQRTGLEVLALVAANLVRNDTDELLATLTRERPSPPSPAPVGESSISTGNLAISRPANPISRAMTHRWSFGTLAYLSSRSAEPVYTPGSGFFVSRTMSKHLALGLTDIMVFPNGGQTVLSVGPYTEAFWFARNWLQLFGQLGVPLQGRWSTNRPAAFGAQPFLETGLRFWIGGRVSLAAALRVAVVASSAFGAPPTELVQGTVSASGGLELGFHL
jgi:hypothetical protein